MTIAQEITQKPEAKKKRRSRRGRFNVASLESKRAMEKAGVSYRLAYESGDKEARKEAARDLLRAARAWRQSAKERVAEMGMQDKRRPSFKALEGLQLDRSNPPDKNRWARAFHLWASRYAWDSDAGDKEAARESARELLRTASIVPADTELTQVERNDG